LPGGPFSLSLFFPVPEKCCGLSPPDFPFFLRAVGGTPFPFPLTGQAAGPDCLTSRHAASNQPFSETLFSLFPTPSTAEHRRFFNPVFLFFSLPFPDDERFTWHRRRAQPVWGRDVRPPRQGEVTMVFFFLLEALPGPGRLLAPGTGGRDLQSSFFFFFIFFFFFFFLFFERILNLM